MMGNWGYGYMGGFGFFFMILFWGVIIWAIVAGVRMMTCGRGHGHGMGGCCGGSCSKGDGAGDSAMKLLRERFAKGEVTKEQFDQMKKDLSM